MDKETAQGRWQKLSAGKAGLVSRCERYAELTIPSICPPDGYDESSDQLQHDYQSVGSQAANNLVNKMVLAMFAPSRPFMRFELPRAEQAEILKGLQMDANQFREQMALIEMDAVKELDSIGARPKLFDLMAHLIVTGNCLRYQDGDVMRILGIKKFCARRNARGEVIEIIIKEDCQLDELPEEVRPFALHTDPQAAVSMYRWWKWDGNRFQESQYIDNFLIDHNDYTGTYKREDMPVHHHVWQIADGAHYGIGHVEHYVGDLEGASKLSEAEINGAILASEFRWLANPGGMTRVEDVQTSRNGAVIPGMDGDLVLVSAGPVAQTISVVSASADKYIRRIGAGFLLTAGVQRDAERVTAEEIRLLANELETGLGGIYSRLAIDLQLPLAYWLMKRLGNSALVNSDFKPVIVTGLDALSRNGDLENVRAFIADVVQITNLPPETAQYLKLDSLFSALAAGRGLKSSEYVNKQEVVDERNAAAQAQAQEQETAKVATEAQLKRGNQ
ncbi:putative head portal protein [Aeromonas phage 25AhydR2PP]|uniref:Head portal protein n=1 Tax=Aeromonas phage 25AhydR2PP TaxID=2163976 RepID=A0A2S1PFQ9_9CAUD|nr:head-tail adaptor [Aeromonas phage 25AhydR2PP]AWH15411.1 putative head portal protein [Aeromonas phage 25AhydR2PP]